MQVILFGVRTIYGWWSRQQRFHLQWWNGLGVVPCKDCSWRILICSALKREIGDFLSWNRAKNCDFVEGNGKRFSTTKSDWIFCRKSSKLMDLFIIASQLTEKHLRLFCAPMLNTDSLSLWHANFSIQLPFRWLPRIIIHQFSRQMMAFSIFVGVQSLILCNLFSTLQALCKSIFWLVFTVFCERGFVVVVLHNISVIWLANHFNNRDSLVFFLFNRVIVSISIEKESRLLIRFVEDLTGADCLPISRNAN